MLAGSLFAAALVSTSERPRVDGVVISYGEDPSTFGRLWVPAGSEQSDVVVLYHGGFWRRSGGDLSLMTEMAESLVADGYAVWNVEYGRTGERFGGWPSTFEHVTASLAVLDQLGDDFDIDVSTPILAGHSAGGHLALWAAASSQHKIGGVIALAPIVDLERAATNGLGNGAVVDLLGGEPGEVPERYAAAAIGDLGPTPVVVVTSSIDDKVPPRYSAGVRGDQLVEHQFDSVDHLAMIRGDGAVQRFASEAIADFLRNRE